MTQRAVAVALGNIPLQDQIADALALEVEVLACRTDAELLVLLAGRTLAGVVVGPRLVGLERRVLPAIATAGVPVVLLVPAASMGRYQARLAETSPELRVLPDTAAMVEITTALSGDHGPASGPRPAGRRPRVSVAAPAPEPSAPDQGRLVVVTSYGGQGSSTVAVNVGFAYGAGRSVIVQDLDLLSPSLVPLVSGDPSLGLAGVVRALAMGVTALDRVLDEHLQPLGDRRRSPHARLLGGLPLDGKTRTVGADVIIRLLEVLRQRASLVLVDLGHVLGPAERVGAVQRAVLLAADGILVVSGGDGVSLKRTQDYVARLVGAAPHPDPARLALVLNRYQPRAIEPPTELASFLGLPLAACVSADYERALAASGSPQPLVAHSAGPAARELALLASALAAPTWPPSAGTRPALWRSLAEAVGRRGQRALHSGRGLLANLGTHPRRPAGRSRPVARRRSSGFRSP